MLLDLFCTKGIPTHIVSDCGVQFTGELLQQVCKALGINQIYSSVQNAMGWLSDLMEL